MVRKILDSTLESASFNIIFQVFLRFLTFFLNAFVLRYISEAVVGVMNVRLLLLESTILFLSREAFRRAALSQTESHSWPQIINLVWLTVPLSIIISLLFSFLWLYVLSVPSSDITQHYVIGVCSISVSCVIEMLAEPLFIVSQAFLFTKLKVTIDSLVVCIRTVIFVIWIVLKSKQAVIAFSVAQIVANSVYCIGYYAYFYIYIRNNNRNKNEAMLGVLRKLTSTHKAVDFSNDLEEDCEDEEKLEKVEARNEMPNGAGDNGKVKGSIRPSIVRRQSSLVGFDEPFPFSSLLDFLPQPVNDQNWIHPNSAQLTWSFLKQGVLKQILTEGERYVMTLFSVLSFKEQGIYDVINNLGSLAVRFLFRPVEDSLYFYFTQSVKRDVPIKDQNGERMKEASTVLFQVLNCIIAVGLVLFTFGQSYSSLLLYLYGGEAIASGQGPQLLRAHCFSVLLLGINGITECYAFSTMTAQQLNKYNYVMAVFSILFLVVSWCLTRVFGGVGFILANCCNMLARIVHSIMFIRSRYADTSFQPLLGLLPKKFFFISLVISLVITKITEYSCQSLPHFLIGVVCFLIVAIIWSFEKKELVLLALDRWRQRKSKEE